MNELLSGISVSDDQLLKLVIYIIAILIIISLVRSVFRLVMPVVIVGLVMVVFLGFAPGDVINKGKQLVSYGSSFIQDTLLPFIDSNKDATKSENGNNSSENPPWYEYFTEEESKKFLNEKQDSNLLDDPVDKSDVNKL